MMQFTYAAYRELIALLKAQNYRFCGYFDHEGADKRIILRHDIDYSMERAFKLAQVEQEEGVRSTYFALLRTDFYNPASKHMTDMLQQIRGMGHEVGLHFDEVAYEGCSAEELPGLIRREAKLLGDICDFPIRCFSMHRPNRLTLEKDLQVEGLVNSYGQEFFRDFKYLSDSRRNWREPVLDIIRSGQYDKLHILTHAFWYGDEEETISDAVKNYILAAKAERYRHFSENIRALDQLVPFSEIAE